MPPAGSEEHNELSVEELNRSKNSGSFWGSPVPIE